jgi:hypothetical protein
MLPHALYQVRGHTHVQNPVPFVGKHVNTRLARSHVADLHQTPVLLKPSNTSQLRRPGERRDPATSYVIFSTLAIKTNHFSVRSL